MNSLIEYQELSKRTAPPAAKENLSNYALGLSGESSEVATLICLELLIGGKFNINDLKEELGDVMWYISQTASELGFNLNELTLDFFEHKEKYNFVDTTLNGLSLKLLIEAGKFSDIIKKYLYHKHGIEFDEIRESLVMLLANVRLIADQFDLLLSEILKGNIEKLKSRYPDGFSAEASINRVK